MKLTERQLLSLIEDSKLDWKKENIVGKCPKCGHTEFGISLKDNHQFGCYRKVKCGFSGNIFSLLKYLGRWSEFIGGDQIYSNSEGKLINRLLVTQEELIDSQLPTILPPIGFQRIYQHEYLDKRGFTKKDYEKFEVGLAKTDIIYKNYIVFIFRIDGEIKGYLGRHLLSKKEIEEKNKWYKEQQIDKKILRYRNSSSDFSKILGGENELTDNTETVILVEGLFDKRGIDKLLNLDEQEEVKCCFTFKCDVSIYQIYLLQKYKKLKKIILLYDPDVIGQIKKVSLELEKHFPEVVVGYNETGNDPDEMTLTELEQVLSKLQSPENFVQSKITKKLLK